MILSNDFTLKITPVFLLASGVLMETAIVMILLSRLLKRNAIRVANIVAGMIHTLAVTLSMLTAAPPVYYIFFIVIEITCTVSIIILAWRWKETPVSA